MLSVSDEQARTFVKNDYLQRMKRWDNDVQLLGTEIPKITWEKIERSLTDVEDEKTLLVPFKAEGPEGKRMYYGMYIVRRDMLNMRMTNTLL